MEKLDLDAEEKKQVEDYLSTNCYGSSCFKSYESFKEISKKFLDAVQEKS